MAGEGGACGWTVAGVACGWTAGEGAHVAEWQEGGVQGKAWLSLQLWPVGAGVQYWAGSGPPLVSGSHSSHSRAVVCPGVWRE